jgi:hypothetical protein
VARNVEVFDFARMPGVNVLMKSNPVEGDMISVSVESLTIEINPTLF